MSRSSAVGSSRPYRVVVHGLYYFCEKLPGLLGNEQWDVRHCTYSPVGLATLVNDLRRCDLAYTWGGRVTFGKFLWAARSLGKNNIVQLWCGSDVLFAQQQLATKRIEPWIAAKVHWAVSPTLADEVRALGLRCEYVQASFVDPVALPKPLPEQFSVLTYLPSITKGKLYGLDQMLEVAHTLPQIQFNLVGVEEGHVPNAPPNLKVYPRVQLTPFLERATVIWRPVRHDGGISIMVLEALAHGRHVLYSNPFAACTHVTSAAAARAEIEKLFALHKARRLQRNDPGMEVVARSYTSEKVRSELRKRWEEIIKAPGAGARRASTQATHPSSSNLSASELND
ncbi:MAG: hypothetical protein ABSC10_15985 [Candidatus Acidiferrales bacterium]|jgi:hypothetical protein